MSLSNRVQSGAAFQLVARLFSSSVSFVITALVLARVLPDAEYGIFSFYLTAFLLAMTLCDFGANRAAIRLVSAGELKESDAIPAAARFKTWIGVVCFVALVSVVLIAEDGVWTRGLLILASAHAIMHGFSAASVRFEVAVDYRIPALSVIAGYSVFLISGLVLWWVGVETAPPYLVGFGAALATQNLVLWILRGERIPGEENLKDSLALDDGMGDGMASHLTRPEATEVRPEVAIRRLFREALPLGISAVAVSIYYYADTLMLRPLRGEEDVAEYAVAYRLMSFGLMFPVLFSQVLFPVFTLCHERGAELLTNAVRRASLYLSLGAAAGMGVLLARPADVLVLVFGDGYGRAAPSLQVLAVGMGCVFMTYPATTAIIAAGRAGVFTQITVASAFLNIGLNLLLIPDFGPLGAAWTTLATEGFVFLASVIAIWRIAGITGFSMELWKAPALFLVTYGVLVFPAIRDWPILVALPISAAASALLLTRLRVLPFDLGVSEEALEEGLDGAPE